MRLTGSIGSRTKAEWRSNWPLPFVSALGYAVGTSYIYSLGLFIAPLEKEFGWSRMAITSGLSVVSVLFFFLAPFTGSLVDRWGARRVAIPGTVFFCAALSALSFASPSIWSWWALWILVGLGAVCVQAAVWTTAIASRFDETRGLAMAVTLCGAGIASATVPIVTHTLLSEFGWRGAYIALGVLLAALSLPLLFIFFTDAPGRRRNKEMASEGQPGADVPGMSVREAMWSTRFARLAGVSFAIMAAMAALIVHFVPIMTFNRVPISTAATVAGLIGIGSITGRIGAGFLLDRIHGTIVGAASFSLPIVVVGSLLFFGGNTYTAFAIAFTLGLSLGGEVDVIAYLATRYFGLKNFGTLFGTIIGLQTLSLGAGPLIAGFVYDSYNSYDPLLIGLMPVFALSAAMVGSLGPYPEHSNA